VRIGAAAASVHAPKVFTSRAQLWAGSHYQFDDVWHDHFVVFNGLPVRVLEIGALDVRSGCRFAWGTKPRVEKNGKFENLREAEMRFLLASVLWNHGYNPRGTELVVEHGTATVREDIEDVLRRIGELPDKTPIVTVRRGGIQGNELAIGGSWHGTGKGNPRHKGALESLHNLIHNELAMLPGQSGMDKAHRPEALDNANGLLGQTDKLLKVKAQLPPERAALLKLPLLEYHSHFLPLLLDVYDRINGRDWHELEGWAASGFVTLDYKVAPEAIEWVGTERLLAMPAPLREALVAAARQDARLLRQRKLSPTEVWQAGRGQLQRVPAHVIADILGEDLAEERKCKNAYFEFDDMELSPEELRYEGRILTPDGREEELRDDTYQTFCNPFDLGQLFIHDAKGRHLGVARRVKRGVNAAEIQRELGRQRERLADLQRPLLARHAAEARAEARRLEHNADVIAGAPVTPEEKQRAAEVAANLRDFGAEAAREILQGEGPEPPEGGTPDGAGSDADFLSQI